MVADRKPPGRRVGRRDLSNPGACLGAMNLAFFLATVNLLLGGLVFLLGVAVLRENPRQRLNRVVALMMFFGGFGALLTALGLLHSLRCRRRGARRNAAAPTDATVSTSPTSWEFFFPSMFLFACLFPQERRFTRMLSKPPRLLRWLPPFDLLVYLPHLFHFVLLFVLSFVGPWLDSRTSPRARSPSLPLLNLGRLFLVLFFSVHQALFSLVNLVYGIGAVALLANSYRTRAVPRLRQQLRRHQRRPERACCSTAWAR